MKKYFAILLTIAMAACANEPTGGDGDTGGNTGGVPDNGLGYYENAKALLSTLTPITNDGQYELPIVSAGHSGKNVGNHIPNSYSQRIPTAVTLSDGRVALTGDIRWPRGNADAPHLTSSFFRISKDAKANSWDDIKVLNRFNDFDTTTITEEVSGQIIIAAGLVDNAIVVGPNDTLIALSMMNPPTVGLHGGSTDSFEDVHPFTNHGGKQYLLLRDSGETAADLPNYGLGQAPAGGPIDNYKPQDTTYFKYGVDVEGGPIVEFTATGPVSVTPALYADEYWELYTDVDFKTPFLTNQIAMNGTKYKWSDTKAHAHLFFYASPYWPSRVNSYLSYSKSTDKGNTWSKIKDITHQVKKESHKAGILINSPAKGYTKRFGANKGRIFFSAYKHGIGGGRSEKPLVFWTDDLGENWGSADDFVAQSATGDTGSESTVVETPNGDLILVSRANGKPTYSVSLDSGKTWSALRVIPEPAGDGGYFSAAQYNQLTVINIDQHKAQDGRALVAFSYAKSASRTRQNGTLTFAALTLNGKLDDPNRDWAFDFKFNGGDGVQRLYTERNGQHDYSGLTELQDGSISVFFEGTHWVQDIQGELSFVTIPLQGL